MNNFLIIHVLTFKFSQTVKCDFSFSEEDNDETIEVLKGEQDTRKEDNNYQPLDPVESFNMMKSIIKMMFQKLNTMDTVDVDDDKNKTGVWKDDRRHLIIPQFHSRQYHLSLYYQD